MKHNDSAGPGSRILPAVVACLGTLLGTAPLSAAVNIPSVPVTAGAGAAPNIMFILDDSGSMQSEVMPDNLAPTVYYKIEDGEWDEWEWWPRLSIGYLFKRPSFVYGKTFDGDTVGQYENIVADPKNVYGYITRSPYFNKTYYNPEVEYLPWVKADGTSYPDATPSCAPNNPENASAGCRNLTSTQTETAYWQRTSQYCPDWAPRACLVDYDTRSYSPAVYYVYTGDNSEGQPDWDPDNYDRVNIPQSQMQNFANWYTYYRSRILAARAGIGRAFSELPDDSSSAPRVGFATINTPGAVVNHVRPFSGDNRKAFYEELYGRTVPNAGTPLRRALDDVGQYYMSETGVNDPWSSTPGERTDEEPLTCRGSFAILMTDGYWSENTENNQSNDANVATGNQDGGQPDPFSDEWSNTLADVAMYYWKNDLRGDINDNVPTTDLDPADWQHMVTFGVGLGVAGTGITRDEAFGAIPDNSNIPWLQPSEADKRTKIDDLLHAAVNSRGDFFSAADPEAFAKGLSKVLLTISERVGSRANVSANSTALNDGARIYQATYLGGQWTGNLSAYRAEDLGLGKDAALDWTASIPDSGRRVLTLGGDFPTAAQEAALGASVAAYLEGDRTQEQRNGGSLRNRSSLLGDIVHSTPVFVEANLPATDGTDTDDTIYVGANDGMLHAFNAHTGVERFAYVPGGVSTTALKELADPDYSHRFYVDGPLAASGREITTSATYPSGRDILVGTLGRGGAGIFALDVTNPGSPQVLWDKSGIADLGVVIGTPLITRVNDGTTTGRLAVIVANGITADGPDLKLGSGKSTLFVYDLVTGAEIAKIEAPEASGGLSKPKGWDPDDNGTVDYIYVGDMEGNLWKFDLTSSDSTKWAKATTKLFSAVRGGVAQPITGGVSIAADPATNKRWVFFGTGSMLAKGDLADRDPQSFYGVIDSGEKSQKTLTRADLHARSIVSIGVDSEGHALRGFEAHDNDGLGVDEKGWYFDLLQPSVDGAVAEGERIVGSPQTIAGVLAFNSRIPSADPCQPEGRGYRYAIDAFTGTSTQHPFYQDDVDGDGDVDEDDRLNGQPVGGKELGIGMLGDTVFVGDKAYTGGDPDMDEDETDLDIPRGRISWREIIGD